MNNINKPARCPYELAVEDFYGEKFPTETTEIKTDFGMLCNLLAAWDQKNQPSANHITEDGITGEIKEKMDAQAVYYANSIRTMVSHPQILKRLEDVYTAHLYGQESGYRLAQTALASRDAEIEKLKEQVGRNVNELLSAALPQELSDANAKIAHLLTSNAKQRAKIEKLEKEIRESTRFEQGYACALSCITAGHGEMTEVEEAMRAGIGTYEQVKAIPGIDEHDLEILKVYERSPHYNCTSGLTNDAPDTERIK